MHVELYTKPECPLCELGAALVADVCRRLSIEWSETSIYASEVLFERYRYQVPVLCVNGREVATLRFDAAHIEGQLRTALDTVGVR
jgi:glutaredoxin